jgi:hypothetical protein
MRTRRQSRASAAGSWRSKELRSVADRRASVGAFRRLADRVEDASVEEAMRSGWGWPEVAETPGNLINVVVARARRAGPKPPRQR